MASKDLVVKLNQISSSSAQFKHSVLASGVVGTFMGAPLVAQASFAELEAQKELLEAQVRTFAPIFGTIADVVHLWNAREGLWAQPIARSELWESMMDDAIKALECVNPDKSAAAVVLELIEMLKDLESDA